MRNCNRHLIGIISFAVGIAIMISIILPNWLWTVCFAFALIISGIFCCR